jgi:hypothetical protein
MLADYCGNGGVKVFGGIVDAGGPRAPGGMIAFGKAFPGAGSD